MPRSRHRKKKSGRAQPWKRYALDDDFGALTPPDEKMSGVILRFLEPYRTIARDETAFENLVALGVVAWNVAILPVEEREQALDEFAGAFGIGRFSVLGRIGRWFWAKMGLSPSGGVRQSRTIRDFKATVGEMIDRKLREYPNNRRFILDYQIGGAGEEVQLFIISTLERPRV